jgi:hypothetical protein
LGAVLARLLLRERALAGSAHAAAPAAPTLGAIRAVTITAADLAVVESAWTTYMGYRVVSKGLLPKQTVEGWGAPGLAGKPFLILGPESGEPTLLRFVEQPTPEKFDFDGTYGWRATEITVQDSDKLYARLKDSPFKVRGPPQFVPTYTYLKALGAVGPAGERLNLTWITEKRPDLAEAKSFVGRCFITTQAVPDLAAALEWYHTTFGNEASPIRQLPNFKLAVVKLSDSTKIEVDSHNGVGRVRERIGGGLPPGVALVSFECRAFKRHRKSFLAPPAPGALEPFHGKRVGTLLGTGGELIELIET